MDDLIRQPLFALKNQFPGRLYHGLDGSVFLRYGGIDADIDGYRVGALLEVVDGFVVNTQAQSLGALQYPAVFIFNTKDNEFIVAHAHCQVSGSTEVVGNGSGNVHQSFVAKAAATEKVELAEVIDIDHQ